MIKRTYLKYCVWVASITLIAVLLTSCESRYSIVLKNESYQIFTVEICHLNVVDSSGNNTVDRNEFGLYPKDLNNENSYINMNGAIDSCYEFKINHGEEIGIYSSSRPPFGDNRSQLLGSIKIEGDNYKLYAAKNKVEELFTLTDSGDAGAKYEFIIK